MLKKLYLIIVFIFVLSQMIPLFPSRYIFLALGLCLISISSTFKPNFSAGKEYKKWMTLVSFFILISTLWSINPRLTLYTFAINVFPLFCLTYSLSRYINSYDKFIKIFRLVYLAGVISLIYLYLFIDITHLADNRINSAFTDENLFETWNPNAIGMNFSLTIMFGYIIAKYYKNKFLWIIWIAISLIMIIAILLTGSRKAILLLILPFIIFALYDYKRHFLKSIALVISAIGIIWIALKVPFFYDIIGRRIEDFINIAIGNENGTEDTSRKYLIRMGLDWFYEKPLLGYGMNCYRVLSNSVPMFRGLNFYAHNNYIEILVGGGIIGFFIYYSYVFVLVRRLWHHREIIYRYVTITLCILLIMDFAQVSYYDAIMQILILFAFIMIRIPQYSRQIIIRYENN